MEHFTAGWWGLYTSMDGAEECAKHITQRLLYHTGKACECMKDDHTFNSNEAGALVYREMLTALGQYSKWGANDTEPRYALRSWIRNKFNEEAC